MLGFHIDIGVFPNISPKRCVFFWGFGGSCSYITPKTNMAMKKSTICSMHFQLKKPASYVSKYRSVSYFHLSRCLFTTSYVQFENRISHL